MKTFFRFLREAEETGPAAQARKRRLKSDGHGGWLDVRGKYVARTVGDKLEFTNQRSPKDEGPVQQMAKRRADDDLAGAPLQRKPDPKRAAKPQEDPKTAKKPEKEEESSFKKSSDDITLAFGRFNPPHIGHEKLIGVAKKLARGGDMKIYPSRTEDPKKNPLSADMKVSYMKKMFPDYKENIVNDTEMVSIFNVLGAASEEGYKSVTIVAGPERIADYTRIADDYNGIEKNGVVYFDFPDGIEVVPAGPRDDSADDDTGASATKQRLAVLDDDLEAFKKFLPKDFDEADAQALFDAVRQGMEKKKAAKESFDIWEVAPKADPRSLRENYMLGNIFNLGEVVESLNTGLIGKVIRKGTNYLICVTEQNYMFKSWIHDVMETKDKKVKTATETGIYGVPAKDREIGTKSHLRYAQSMVPGQGEIKNFNIREFINRHRVKS